MACWVIESVLLHSSEVLGMSSWDIYPRYAQKFGDSGFAMQLNAEILRAFTQLHYTEVG